MIVIIKRAQEHLICCPNQQKLFSCCCTRFVWAANFPGAKCFWHQVQRENQQVHQHSQAEAHAKEVELIQALINALPNQLYFLTQFEMPIFHSITKFQFTL